MRLLRFLIVAATISLLIAAPAFCAVNSMTLQSATDLALTGKATVISGMFGGATPHTRVEINAKMDTMPASDHVYVGWLVDSKDNVKQSLGVFRGDKLTSDIALTNWSPTASWTSFAVSLEPANSMTPGPTTVVAVGNLPESTISTEEFARMAILPSDESFQKQLVAQRFNITTDQVTNLRTMGLGYRDINLAANIAKQVNQPITRVAETYMREGGDLDKVAVACRTTVTAMTELAPFTAVAGSIQETGRVTAGMMIAARQARAYPAEAPVLSYDQWRTYSEQGYSWIDVAAAANIRSLNGDNMDDLLRMARTQGRFWRDIAAERGLDADKVLGFSAWNWERIGRSLSVTDRDMRRTTVRHETVITSPQPVAPSPPEQESTSVWSAPEYNMD